MANEAAAPGLNRRDFLKKVAVGAAAAAGLSAAMQRKVTGEVAMPSMELPEDSIFTPREDQRARVMGK